MNDAGRRKAGPGVADQTRTVPAAPDAPAVRGGFTKVPNGVLLDPALSRDALATYVQVRHAEWELGGPVTVYDLTGRLSVRPPEGSTRRGGTASRKNVLAWLAELVSHGHLATEKGSGRTPARWSAEAVVVESERRSKLAGSERRSNARFAESKRRSKASGATQLRLARDEVKTEDESRSVLDDAPALSERPALAESERHSNGEGSDEERRRIAAEMRAWVETRKRERAAEELDEGAA